MYDIDLNILKENIV